MKNQTQKLPIALFLTALHNVLFWNEYLGINALIYSTILIGLLWFLNPLSFKTSNVRITLAGTLLSGIFVILNGSDIAKFSHFASLFLLVGFIHAPMLRSIIFAIGAVLETMFKLPSSMKKPATEESPNKSRANVYRRIRLSIIPIIALIIFYWIYKFANPVFDKLSSDFWDTIGENIAAIFENFSFARISFGLLGFAIAITALYQPFVHAFLESELKLNDRLSRIKNRFSKKDRPTVSFKTFSLVNEYQSAIIMVALINLLLLIVNGIDINWIWFNFDIKSAGNLSQFVHEGTYLLIASILLSMGIIEYFFRKNLNFYTKNKALKTLCYLWIAQNIIMVVSVAIRNYHYIAQHGLAYKRIGVIFFLALTIVGLISQAYKINQTRSGYFMLRINSWAVYVVMLVIAGFNWDIIIAKHNISHPQSENIDTKFLLSLSPKTLTILQKNKALFEPQTFNVLHNTSEYSYDTEMSGSTYIDYKINRFIKNYEERNWLEWNYADACAYAELKSK